MYTINLIGQRIVPRKRKRAIFSVISASILGYILTFLYIAFFAMSDSSMVNVYAGEVQKLTAAFEGSDDALSRADLEERFDEMRPEAVEIQGLVEGQKDFTGIWAGIARSVPDSVWLTGVRVSYADEGTQANGRSNASRNGFIVEGQALRDTERGECTAINRFSTRLREDELLSQYIAEARFVETGVEVIGGTSVVEFEIKCSSR